MPDGEQGFHNMSIIESMNRRVCNITDTTEGCFPQRLAAIFSPAVFFFIVPFSQSHLLMSARMNPSRAGRQPWVNSLVNR
jgi:hypothetical protein